MSIFSHTHIHVRAIVKDDDLPGSVQPTDTAADSQATPATTPAATPVADAADAAVSPKDAHSTGVGDSGRWSTRRIAMYACFVALSMALSFVEFPLIPGVPWLKYDPSGIVALVAGFAYGPAAALIVSILGFVPHLFISPWGTLMAWLVAIGLSVPAAVIYRRMHTRPGAVLGLVVGAIVALTLAILGNLVITPMYAHMTVAQVAALIVPALLPFNLAKYAINCVVTFLIYKPVSELLNKSAR